MSVTRKVLLYLMSLFYVLMGVMHFVKPEFYRVLMPDWLPAHEALIYISGIAEILLGVMLLFNKTRSFSAKLIIVMLIAFLVLIHIPQSISFYKTGHKDLVVSLVRLPIQFLFMAWARMFTKG